MSRFLMFLSAGAPLVRSSVTIVYITRLELAKALPCHADFSIRCFYRFSVLPCLHGNDSCLTVV